MELKRKTYNIIIIVMIILISAVVIFSATELTTPEQTTPNDTVAEENIVDSENPTTITPSEELVQSANNKNYLPKASSFSKAWPAITYANKLLENYSFSSTMTQTSSNDPVLNMVVTQNVSQQKYKTKDEVLLINIGTCSNSEGANYYRYTYMNEVENVVKRRTNTSGPSANFTNQPTETFTVDNYKTSNGSLPYQMYYTLNANFVEIDTFSISGSDYVITAHVKEDTSGAFAGFEKFIMNSPAEVKDFKAISASFEIRINRKTGAYKSIKVVERYSVTKKTNSFGWQGATITQTSTEYFDFADINISKLVQSTVK